MKPWGAILAALVIFACGVVTGAMLSVHHPAAVASPDVAATIEKNRNTSPLPLQRMEFLRRMEKHLNLTAQQKERIEKIMHDSLDRTKPLWDQIAPQMREETQKVREEIRAELTPEQQTKYEAMLKPHARGEEAKAAEKRRRPKAESTNNRPELTNRVEKAD